MKEYEFLQDVPVLKRGAASYLLADLKSSINAIIVFLSTEIQVHWEAEKIFEETLDELHKALRLGRN